MWLTAPSVSVSLISHMPKSSQCHLGHRSPHAQHGCICTKLAETLCSRFSPTVSKQKQKCYQFIKHQAIGLWTNTYTHSHTHKAIHTITFQAQTQVCMCEELWGYSQENVETLKQAINNVLRFLWNWLRGTAHEYMRRCAATHACFPVCALEWVISLYLSIQPMQSCSLGPMHLGEE